MFLENWMIVAMFAFFGFALYRTWQKGIQEGRTEGAEGLARMLDDLGIIHVSEEDGILKIYNMEDKEENDEETS